MLNYYLILAFSIGFLTMSLEMQVLRLAQYYIGSSVIVTGTTISTFLFAMAFGNKFTLLNLKLILMLVSDKLNLC